MSFKSEVMLILLVLKLESKSCHFLTPPPTRDYIVYGWSQKHGLSGIKNQRSPQNKSEYWQRNPYCKTAANFQWVGCQRLQTGSCKLSGKLNWITYSVLESASLCKLLIRFAHKSNPWIKKV